VSSVKSQDFDVTAEALSLIANGLDVIPLKPREKGTNVEGWTTAPRHTADSFRAALRPGGNLGLRTGRAVAGGYLHDVDYDVNVSTPESLAVLHELIPPDVLPTCPTVITGNASGNRRHFYIVTDEPLAKAVRKGPWGKIELLGLGQQAVLPPSIHPDSGRPYRWERPLDDMADLLGLPPAPRIPVDRCRAWGARRFAEAVESPDGDEEADYALILDQVGYAEDLASGKLAAALDAIGPEALDYDAFFAIGAALHRGSGGSDEGLALWSGCVNRSYWHESAVTGEPMRGGPNAGQHAKLGQRRATAERAAEDQAKRWKGYREDHPRPRRLGTIYGLARAAGWTWEGDRELDLDELDDLEDSDLEALDGKPEGAEDHAARLRLLTPAECEAAPSRGYVIKGLLAPGDLAMIFGQPGTGKSLLAPFLGYMVALGDPVDSPDAPAHPEPGELDGDGPTAPRVFGLRTKRTGPVLYFAAEDPSGMRGRVKALRRRYGDAAGFRLVVGGTSLMPGSADLARMREIVAELKPSLIFIDTQQIAFPPGPKMEAEKEAHYGAIVRSGRALAAGGAAVVLIHHPPKTGDTPRGSGVLNGALDVSIHIERGEGGVVRVAGGMLLKNRNGAPHLDMAFRVEVEDGGVDEDGDRITLPVCAPLAPGDAAFRDLRPAEAKALDVLRGMIAEARQIDPTASSVPEDGWQAACVAPGVLSASEDPKNRAHAFRRARKGLADKGRTTADNGHVRENAIDPNDLPDRGQRGHVRTG
jgi:Bifunctional DNA primase/polymerase, N-terminal/AAA domain